MPQVYEVYDATGGEFCGFEEKTGQGASEARSLLRVFAVMANGFRRDTTSRS